MGEYGGAALTVEGDVYAVNDLLRVRTEGMHGGNDNQHQQHQEHSIFAHTLTFIVSDYFQELQPLLPRYAAIALKALLLTKKCQ